MSWTTANNPLEVENSSSTARSETSQGTAKDNSDNCATFSRMQQTQKNELFSVQNKQIFAHEKIPQWSWTSSKTKEIIFKAQPPLQTDCSKIQTTAINPTEAN